MTQRKPRLRMTPQPTYDETQVALDQCPNCGNERITKTPRRKSGPSMFHCRKCSYMTSIDQLFDMYRLLGQVPA